MTEQQVFEYEVSDASGKLIICQIQADDLHEAEEGLIKAGWMVGDLKRILIDSSQTHIQSLPKVQIMSAKATVPKYMFLGLMADVLTITGSIIFLVGLILILLAAGHRFDIPILQLVIIIGSTLMYGLSLASFGEFLRATKDIAQNSYKAL